MQNESYFVLQKIQRLFWGLAFIAAGLDFTKGSVDGLSDLKERGSDTSMRRYSYFARMKDDLTYFFKASIIFSIEEVQIQEAVSKTRSMEVTIDGGLG